MPTRNERLERDIADNRSLLKMLCRKRMEGRAVEDAEGLESRVVFCACRGIAKYDATRSTFGTWLGGIVRWEAKGMNLRESAKRRPTCVPASDATERAILEVAAPEDDSLAIRELAGEVLSAASELPPRTKRVFFRMLVDGATNTKVASEMGINVRAVNRCLNRARAQIELRMVS